MSWRVVYGETMAAWEQTFPTHRQAVAFAKEQRRLGDVIFSVAKVDPNDPGPHSLAGAIEAMLITSVDVT